MIVFENDKPTYDVLGLTRHELLALRDAITYSSRPLVAEFLADLVLEIDAVIPEPADA